MLKGAYSHISNFNKLILLVTLVFSLLLFSTLIGILALVPFYGKGVLVILSSPDFTNASVINALKALQIMNMAVGLLLPAIFYLWLCSPAGESFQGLKKPVIPVSILLSVVLIAVSQPFIGWTSELNSHLALPDWLSNMELWMKNSEKQGELITEAFLATTSGTGLAVNIFMIAILPAFAEEFLFRGVLTTLFKQWTRNTHLAVIFSAFIFAAIHLQFYGFLPRFLLGVALGYLYVWSGSLWLPIAAHFTNNFLSVLIEFLYKKGALSTNAENFAMNNSAWITFLSITSVAAILLSIYRITAANKDHIPE